MRALWHIRRRKKKEERIKNNLPLTQRYERLIITKFQRFTVTECRSLQISHISKKVWKLVITIYHKHFKMLLKLIITQTCQKTLRRTFCHRIPQQTSYNLIHVLIYYRQTCLLVSSHMSQHDIKKKKRHRRVVSTAVRRHSLKPSQ